ncbi:hypothetical protein ELI02_03075 [Rhizobium leguminosarum]|uniref:Uncharacterized protein n=1 Tax=Rhizobium leguminosarum TaxID=384 RepID=A0A4Q8XSQ2_RHILE|nr:hypothetical protein [Rhizobium leguminosarum]TAX54293.1 hypothetical protein ELI01_02980 [Rhizobium leguminosarum]TAX59084.1 hypothetical protein ELI02_03075 [Rhizobium leguminosarum]TAX65882.1 hypothetical protein ELI03_30365 [Rhizobium leguminosarum]TAY00202.1 hypothetical protein ELH95_03190 [Rhizobium leguminosarum]TAY06684.1 hypothetical protein ELH91_27770 [Rhizobium leguminosarum]
MVQLTKAVDWPVRLPAPFAPDHEAAAIAVAFAADVTGYSEYVIAYAATSASVKQTGTEHVDA